jgi:hypothetical protein
VTERLKKPALRRRAAPADKQKRRGAVTGGVTGDVVPRPEDDDTEAAPTVIDVEAGNAKKRFT